MKSITLLTWPNYIDPATLHQFEAASGIHVELDIVPSAVELVSRMRQGPGIDLLCPPDYAVRELAAEGLLLDLDHKLLPNLQHLEPRFLSGRAHDLGSRVSVVKDWGTTGILFRTDLLEEQPRSWSDFWRLAPRHSGKVSVLDSPGEVIGAALKLRGHSYNAVDAVALERAEADLRELAQHLFAFETDYRPLLAAGKVWLALGWNGDAAALRSEGFAVQYAIPTEGSQVWEDDWAIASSSADSASAHAFLNFVLEPHVAAQEARYTRYATGNRGALQLLDPSIQKDRSTYPPSDIIETLEPGMPLDTDGAARRAALWRRIRG